MKSSLRISVSLELCRQQQHQQQQREESKSSNVALCLLFSKEVNRGEKSKHHQTEFTSFLKVSLSFFFLDANLSLPLNTQPTTTNDDESLL